MNGPALDEVRNARTEIIRQFRHLAEFAGAGIGENNGKLSVRVNWRVLPKFLPLPSSVGGVAITHHEVGSITPQSPPQ